MSTKISSSELLLDQTDPLRRLGQEKQEVVLSIIAAALGRRMLRRYDVDQLRVLLGVGDGQVLVTLNGGHVVRVQRIERPDTKPVAQTTEP